MTDMLRVQADGHKQFCLSLEAQIITDCNFARDGKVIVAHGNTAYIEVSRFNRFDSGACFWPTDADGSRVGDGARWNPGQEVALYRAISVVANRSRRWVKVSNHD